MRKGFIFRVNQSLRHHAQHRLALELIRQGLLQPIANLPLRHRDVRFQTHRWHLFGRRRFFVPQETAALRTVTVRDRDFVLAQQPSDRTRRAGRHRFLRIGAHRAFILQSIPAQGNDDLSLHIRPASLLVAR